MHGSFVYVMFQLSSYNVIEIQLNFSKCLTVSFQNACNRLITRKADIFEVLRVALTFHYCIMQNYVSEEYEQSKLNKL